MSNLWKLIISLVIPQLAGGLGSLFTSRSLGSWYKNLQKSPLNPPGWVFGPVWTTLFLLMGIALFLVWRKENVAGKNLALTVFGIQLALNILWSLLFFGMKNPLAALIEIAFLWLAILINILVFYPISKPAAFLLLPYLLWVSFASYLNFSLWKLNF